MLSVEQRRRRYRDVVRFPKRHYLDRWRKPGCVWNWHGPLPWWADFRKTVPCGERVVPPR